MARGQGSVRFAPGAVAVMLAAGFGCALSNSSQSFSDSSQSFSDSSQSVSRSVSGSSRSVSGSSSPEEQVAARYSRDVADYTEAWLVAGGSQAGFLRGVGDIARRRGISDWESDRDTWLGMGRGLARVQVGELQLEVYKRDWSGGDSERMHSIQKGYEAGR